jgi:hypothetical protein
MVSKTPAKKAPAKKAAPRPFHLRFDITVGVQETQTRFVNRITNLVFENYVDLKPERALQANWSMANGLGEKYASFKTFKDYSRGDFLRTLECIELAFGSLKSDEERTSFGYALQHAMSFSESDIGIAWEKGKFRRSGSSLLDASLVNDPLGLTTQPKFKSVREPFVKALTHLLEGERRHELYSDAVTDAYEALEACAKVCTGRESKDLSSNAESYIAQIKVSAAFKEVLRTNIKTYIQFANVYRHADKPDGERAPPKKAEAEAFVYYTGLFIRLGVNGGEG